MSRYRFSPFEVEEQCMHAKRSHYYDRDCDGPGLVLVIDGKRAALRSNGIPRFIDEDRVNFDIVMAHAQPPAEVTKNLMVHLPLKAFEPLFHHNPIDIFIDIDDNGTMYSIGATIPKDMDNISMGSHVRDEDMAPG